MMNPSQTPSLIERLRAESEKLWNRMERYGPPPISKLLTEAADALAAEVKRLEAEIAAGKILRDGIRNQCDAAEAEVKALLERCWRLEEGLRSAVSCGRELDGRDNSCDPTDDGFWDDLEALSRGGEAK